VAEVASGSGQLELLLLHALPLDGSMWAAQMNLLPGSTHAPDLYGLGDGVRAWASRVLQSVTSDRLIVVGCSLGGSCGLEMAAAAPDRVAALVLIGTKAAHRADPALEASVLSMVRENGMERAWETVWATMFSPSTDAPVIEQARRIALRQSADDISRGVAAFHGRPSRDQLLPTLDCPVIIVSGAEDRAPGPQVAATQATLARRGLLHIVPACGHYVPMEAPDRLNSILSELIATL
jgi:pimeloyl-ACP methyl ester carboxylesterase